jgi:receptor-type tyrosine-protein phosphatase N
VPGRHQNFHPTQEPPEDADTTSQEPYVVDTDYVNVEFKNNVYTWAEGNLLINNISNLLKLEPSAFSHARTDHNEVTFKVEPNHKGWNSTQVAQQIGMIRDELRDATGIVITSVGIGDKTKLRKIISPIYDNEFYIVIFMVCGVLGAMIVAASLLILIRRHLKSKEKLQGLSRPDTEASKDYQDLCRARMAVKGQPVGDTVHGRITSLSRESEQSPSSRSSTSSWSEEPALHNMDISTGHMVLSYMEDHLKNKDRLEQEWVALCAYVAEPCDISIASKKENLEKNRYADIVPYDHSRVVLNELSNAASSDYINASSITDHDPRNPAYIATQGPLPHTAPDFWQLIWEQGAVVIVMLTRLTEGGAAMCHRYWPEEGSELYHIYEVHLVSEHIWCDDYLVRSFYLKNVRTGETRTVTQFHFLSWPESGVPASTKALLEFRRKVNKSYRGRSCPIVVHCSDGAGRTGTYCLIDMVLSRMAKGAKEIDIAATLEHLRDQRPRMVATKQQFEFVLTAVAEEVHAILKALPPQPSPAQADKDKQ